MRQYTLAALLLTFITTLHAGESDSLAPIIVTATRTAQTADETLAPVTVITHDDIERTQARSVQDLLRGTPGLTIANNGGPGKTTSFFLRGTESDHVLVLIDGLKVGSATLGTTAFQDLPVEQIERIEIVRGPRSSLYGSEAIGGVIQIFTRKGGGGLRPYGHVGVGSYSSYEASAGVSGGNKNAWFNASISAQDTEGFNACNGPGGCFTIEPDKDGYRNLSSALRGGGRVGKIFEGELFELVTRGESEFDGGFVNESKTLQHILGTRLRLTPIEPWRINLLAGRSEDKTDNFKDGGFQTRFDTRRDTTSLQNDVAIGEQHLITLGLDYQKDRVESTTDYDETSRRNVGLFTQYQANIGAHDLQASIRGDDNEQFDRHDTGSLAWGMRINRALRLTTSYGTAFKAPTFNELYFPGFGNATLKPEESRSAEIGLRARHGWGDWAMHVYQSRVDELIAFDADTFAPANIASARITGLEGELNARIEDWDLNATLTLLDPENRSSGEDQGNVLPRRARQALRLDADRAMGPYRLGATLFAQGKRYDDLANTRELDPYATVDLRGEYRFARDWRLQARIANLFNKQYETASFYNQPGLSGFLTLRYRPADK